MSTKRGIEEVHREEKKCSLSQDAAITSGATNTGSVIECKRQKLDVPLTGTTSQVTSVIGAGVGTAVVKLEPTKPLSVAISPAISIGVRTKLPTDSAASVAVATASSSSTTASSSNTRPAPQHAALQASNHPGCIIKLEEPEKVRPQPQLHIQPQINQHIGQVPVAVPVVGNSCSNNNHNLGAGTAPTVTLPIASNDHQPSNQSMSTISSSESSGKSSSQPQNVLRVGPATGTVTAATITPSITPGNNPLPQQPKAGTAISTTATVKIPPPIHSQLGPARAISVVARTAPQTTIITTASTIKQPTAQPQPLPQPQPHRVPPIQPQSQLRMGQPQTQTPPIHINRMEKKLTPPPPLKATKMIHLKKKYMPQLEYMRREFKKLERQLLGAKSTAKNLTESAGSKERREKLHSFIVHLEDTMNQVTIGCSLEDKRKSTVSASPPAAIAQNNAMGAPLSGVSDQGGADLEVIAEVSLEEEEAKKEFARTSALTKLTKEKEEEENVQKLEEHILANLLPVKERLTKQLAAQQGAARNPAGIPRRGALPSNVPKKGLATGVASGDGTNSSQSHASTGVDQTQGYSQQHHIRSNALSPLNPPSSGPIAGPTAHSQFGKPLKGGGSSLTQKLHGRTLGSQERARGHGVGAGTAAAGVAVKAGHPATSTGLTSPDATGRKVIYAGMTPGSKQVRSGVSAATGVHEMIIENPRHKNITDGPVSVGAVSNITSAAAPPPPPPSKLITPKTNGRIVRPIAKVGPAIITSVKAPIRAGTLMKNSLVRPNAQPIDVKSKTVAPGTTIQTYAPVGTGSTVAQRQLKTGIKGPTTILQDDSKIKKKIRKDDKRRTDQDRHRQISVQQQLQRQQQGQSGRRPGKPVLTSSRILSNQRKGPRTVEYICALCNESYKSSCDCNPWWALSSHECTKCGKTQIPRLDISAPTNAIEYHPALLAHANSDDAGKGKTVSVSEIRKQYPRTPDIGISKAGIYSHGSDGEFSLSDSEEELHENMSPSAKAENEDFGENYNGPKFSDYDASRLLKIMAHASTCPGHHKTAKARDACTNVKLMMLHVRDCPGTTPSYDICPYPWCRKTKHLLYHLVSCEDSDQCKICSPVDITGNLQALEGLNRFRHKKQKEKQAAASLSAATSALKSPNNKNGTTSQTSNSGITKKIAQPRRVARAIITTHGARVSKASKLGHGNRPTYVQSQNTVANKKISLSVPSPIPTAPLSCIKPINPLSAHGSRTQHPPSTQIFLAARNNVKPLVTMGVTPTSASNHLHVSVASKVPANPLNALPPSLPPSLSSQKASSPPNPLKALPPAEPSTHAFQFTSSTGNNVNSNDRHPAIRSNGVEIKVDGNQ